MGSEIVSQVTSSSMSTLLFGIFNQSKMPMVFPPSHHG